MGAADRAKFVRALREELAALERLTPRQRASRAASTLLVCGVFCAFAAIAVFLLS